MYSVNIEPAVSDLYHRYFPTRPEHKKASYCWEWADRTYAAYPADDGYFRRENFGGSFVCSIVLIYSPDTANAYGARGGTSGGIGWVCGLKVVK